MISLGHTELMNGMFVYRLEIQTADFKLKLKNKYPIGNDYQDMACLSTLTN